MTLYKNKYRIESTRLKDWDYSRNGCYFVTICTQDKKCLFGDVIDEKVQLSAIGEMVADEWQKTAQIRKNVSLDTWIIMPNHVHGIIVINNDVETPRWGVSRIHTTQNDKAPNDYIKTPLQCKKETSQRDVSTTYAAQRQDIERLQQMPLQCKKETSQRDVSTIGTTQNDGTSNGCVQTPLQGKKETSQRDVSTIGTAQNSKTSNDCGKTLGANAAFNRGGQGKLKSGSLGAIIGQFKAQCKKRTIAAGHDFSWQTRFYDHIIRNEKSLNKIREYIINNPLKWELDKNNPTNLFM